MEGEVDQITIIQIFIALLFVGGTVKAYYFGRNHDAPEYIDCQSPEENNFDFNVVTKLLVVGGIGMVLWLCCGGFNRPIGAPPQVGTPSASVSAPTDVGGTRRQD
jgi:hypothetical protein